jgi:hypothetical protein
MNPHPDQSLVTSVAARENVFEWVVKCHPGSIQIGIRNKITIGKK